MRRMKWGPMIILCLPIGGVLGAAMILTRIGPGLIPYPPVDNAAWRNETRIQEIDQLQTAIVQYYKAYHSLPITLPADSTQICTSTGTNCASVHMVDMSWLVTGGLYVQGIPHDPTQKQMLPLYGSGYYIASLPGDMVQLRDPEAELGKKIGVVFKL